MDENIKDFIKDAEDIGREMAESYDKGFLESLKKTDKKIIDAFKTRYEAINYQYKYGLISEKEYYDKLAVIRDAYFSRDSQEWHKYNQEILDYKVEVLKEYRKAVEENFEEILKISREKFSAIEKEQEKYAGKLIDFAGGNGFEKHLVTVDNYYPNGGTLKFYDYSVTDFDKEINDLIAFNESIEKFKEKASEIDPEVLQTFFSDLRDMPIGDAKTFLDILLDKDNDGFRKYFEAYESRNNIAEIVSNNLYEGDYENVGKKLKDDLATEFASVPEEFFVYGEMTGESFREGFMSEVQNLIDDIQVHLDVANTKTESSGETSQSIFSPTYYFFGDREKTSRTRLQAKNDALYSYMRGLE